MGGLAAIALEGPKGVGKTRTAMQRARTVHRLDDPAELAVAEADPSPPRRGPASDGTLLGALFESLATLSVHVYAAHNEAKVRHLRTARGRQEVDLIVERADGNVVAIEVKLARTVADEDVKHLTWLKNKLGDRVLDQVVITTGPKAYRREDGVAIVPLALLGP